MAVVFFDQINVVLPKNRIYYRLGYAEGKTKISKEQKVMIEQSIQEALAIIEIKGAALRLSIEKINGSKIFLSNQVSFDSESLVKLLADCKEVIFIGATAGSKIMQTIAKDSQGKNITASVIYDATASEMVDSALDWIIDYSNREFCRENKAIAEQRFSAGYGDFLLENQKTIFEALNMSKIGVNLTESFILVPEKSVTAIAGIKEIN